RPHRSWVSHALKRRRSASPWARARSRHVTIHKYRNASIATASRTTTTIILNVHTPHLRGLNRFRDPAAAAVLREVRLGRAGRLELAGDGGTATTDAHPAGRAPARVTSRTAAAPLAAEMMHPLAAAGRHQVTASTKGPREISAFRSPRK